MTTESRIAKVEELLNDDINHTTDCIVQLLMICKNQEAEISVLKQQIEYLVNKLSIL